MLLIFLASMALAKNEEYIDHFRMDRAGRSMHFVPVRDQDGLGTCYAYATASLIDAWRFSHNAKNGGDENYDHLTSPIEAAIGTSEEFYFRPSTKYVRDKDGKGSVDYKSEGGWACDTVRYLKKKGSCDSRSIKDLYARGATARKFLDGLYNYFIGFNSVMSENLSPEEFRQKMQKYYEHMECYLKVSGFSDSIIPSLNVVIAALEKQKPDPFIDAIMSKSCDESHRQNLSGFRCVEERLTTDFAARNALKEHFLQQDRKTQPLEIDYCSSLLTSKTPFNGGLDMVRKPTENCGLHCSLVIGMRCKMDDSCEYLIRNSWGTTCGYYPARLPCENGNIWVGEDELSKNLLGVSYLIPET